MDDSQQKNFVRWEKPLAIEVFIQSNHNATCDNEEILDGGEQATEERSQRLERGETVFHRNYHGPTERGSLAQ